MSELFNVHAFVPYVAGKSKASDEKTHYLAVAKFKQTEKMTAKGIKAKPSVCASVPRVTIQKEMTVERFLPILQAQMEHAQDEIVKSLYESGKMQVSSSEVDMDSCLSYLSAELEGERLTKDDVKEWFDSSLSVILTAAFSEKLGVSETPTSEQAAKISKAIEDYKNSFAGLSGGKTSYSAPKAMKLLNALELAELQDEVATRFTKRLNKMISEAQDTLESL